MTFLVGVLLGVAVCFVSVKKIKSLQSIKLPSRFNIVKFDNGKYAIRRGFYKYDYRDLKTDNLWWDRHSRHFEECLGSLEECKERSYYGDYGKIVEA